MSDLRTILLMAFPEELSQLAVEILCCYETSTDVFDIRPYPMFSQPYLHLLNIFPSTTWSPE
jgi:hypothetical protein